MTSTDLTISVQVGTNQVALHVLLFEAKDLYTGEAVRRLEGISSAVRPSQALEVVIFIHDGGDSSNRSQSIMQLQIMYVSREDRWAI